jgi:hypothetical protein
MHTSSIIIFQGYYNSIIYSDIDKSTIKDIIYGFSVLVLKILGGIIATLNLFNDRRR